MADEKKTSARDDNDGAPLLPGGEPELSGTGPDGAVFATDGSVTPDSGYDQPSGATTTDGEPAPGVNDVDGDKA